MVPYRVLRELNRKCGLIWACSARNSASDTRLCSSIEQRRAMELQSLVSDAELRALQAQINPHFLFNSLNTLYGTIARENAEARRLVLNLADVFRYFLRS